MYNISTMMRTCAFAVLLAVGAAAAEADGVEFFEKKIRPVLVEHCYACHSAESKPVQGALLVDTRGGLIKGGASGNSSVIPFKPDESPLLNSLKHTGSIKMPPGEKLPDEVFENFAAWIRMGAPDPRTDKTPALPPPYDFAAARKHWAYRPVTDTQPPPVADPLWSTNPIDRFIKAKLEERKLTPVGLASKRALIRRATYDLTGLPPTIEEVDAFLKDTSANAFEKVVDRLLASPAYGERWGRHWLDVVRYADTAGCNSDFPLPDAWRYRNWVIGAFNQDKPYMQFVREQIAGDTLESKDDEDRQGKIVATTYLALSRRFASSKNEHHLTIDDTIDNISKATLGMTVSCARCHDHKFDAIPQRDYFGWYGIFDSTIYTFPGVETVPRPHDFVALSPARQKNLSAWEDKIKEAYAKIRELRFGAGRNKPNSREEIEQLKSQVLALEINPPDIPKAYAVKEGNGHNALMHVKGDPKKLRDEVPRRSGLSVLDGPEIPVSEKGSGRRQLADWLTDPKNPLSTRVMANRIWQWHFGKGIVPTPNDFGVRGEAPTHPELLDFLASRFAEYGYSVKRMHKLVMLSRAYMLASTHSEANAKADPKNEFLWRFDRRRLEAEEIRDSLLAVSGQLDSVPGGEHPFPPLHKWTYTQHKQFFAVYDHNKRSVYLMQQRLRKHPLLELFDPADPNASTGARNSSITALQALAVLNNDFFHTQADQMAVRVGMAYSDMPSRIGYAYKLAFGRPAAPAEVAEGSRYVTQARLALTDSGLPAERHQRAALASYLRVLLSSDEFFFVD
jgi:hypothetical protein